MLLRSLGRRGHFDLPIPLAVDEFDAAPMTHSIRLLAVRHN